MNAYDLFSAMSGADEELLARSQYRVKPKARALPGVLTAAACLALVLLGLWLRPGEQPTVIPGSEPAVEVANSEATIPAVQPLQLNGGDVGTLNIVQLSENTETTAMPDFLIYVNQENYYIGDGSGTYYIYPKDQSGDLPACKMEFTWLPDSSAEAVMEVQAELLRGSMAEVSEPETAAILEGMLLRGGGVEDTLPRMEEYENLTCLEGLTVHGSDGNSGDSEQRDIYVFSDGQNGVFVFTLQYYRDAADGHALRFAEMMQTFEVIDSPDQTPQWLSELLDAVMRLTPAFLENDFSGVKDLLAGDFETLTYGENVYADTNICNIYYEVDDDRNPTSAHVSIRHKYLSPDAYDYITMKLNYDDGLWRAAWAYVEP